jgi:hypothetical protein
MTVQEGLLHICLHKDEPVACGKGTKGADG